MSEKSSPTAAHYERCHYVLTKWTLNECERRRWRYSKVGNEHRIFLVLREHGVVPSVTRTLLCRSTQSAADAAAQAAHIVTHDPHLLSAVEAETPES